MANNTPKTAYSFLKTPIQLTSPGRSINLVTAKQYRAHVKCSLIVDKLLPTIEKTHNEGEMYFKVKSNLNLWCNQALIR